MIFNESIKNNITTATFSDTDEPQTYRCLFAACNNPTCTCSGLTIYFFQKQNKMPLHTIEIDVEKRRLSHLNRKHTPAETKLFAQLKDDDFQFLSTMHFEYKCASTEEADPKTIKTSFNNKNIEKGEMCAYLEILPFAPQLTVMIGEKLHLFLDRYCLSPTCGCTEAMLGIVTQKGGKGETKELCIIQVDYEAKTWKMDKNFSLRTSIKTIQAVAEEQIEAFYETLKNRHLKLKAIYRHNKRNSSPARPLIASPKIARNAPCPCGSGKKYKKCCLRNPTT